MSPFKVGGFVAFGKLVRNGEVLQAIPFLSAGLGLVDNVVLPHIPGDVGSPDGVTPILVWRIGKSQKQPGL